MLYVAMLLGFLIRQDEASLCLSILVHLRGAKATWHELRYSFSYPTGAKISIFQLSFLSRERIVQTLLFPRHEMLIVGILLAGLLHQSYTAQSTVPVPYRLPNPQPVSKVDH